MFGFGEKRVDLRSVVMRKMWAMLWLLGCVGWAQAEEFSAKVITVIDGDTVLVLRGKQKIKIRLADIDAPESAQTFGAESQRSLAELVLKKEVLVSTKAVDDYGRLVANLNLNGMDVNAEQIKRGMAWEYSRSHNKQEYLALQRDAQLAWIGLWGKPDAPQTPSQWRKTHPKDMVMPAMPSLLTLPAADTSCGHKKSCREMNSCQEALFYLTQCGVKGLDGDSDGVPCEGLCAAH
jgi:micrococcal nuclease